MADTNGRVAAEHLATFGSVQVSRAIYPRVVATAADFRKSGYSFNIQPPGGGDRPWDMQTAMRADYQAGKYQQPPYYLSPPPSPIPGAAGTSRHGFALAIDVITNAPTATRNAIMARNGWHLWSSSDPNHFEPNEYNVLVSPPETALAGSGSTPLEDDMFTDDDAARQKNIEKIVAGLQDAVRNSTGGVLVLTQQILAVVHNLEDITSSTRNIITDAATGVPAVLAELKASGVQINEDILSQKVAAALIAGMPALDTTKLTAAIQTLDTHVQQGLTGTITLTPKDK